MSETPSKSRAIAAEVRRRIAEREWRQGERIPDEADLAREFGAARATVNKALQLVADEGLLDRRRRAGTRVTPDPVGRATFAIPIVREEIERAGMAYTHRLVAERRSPLPPDVAARMDLPAGGLLIRLRLLHLGDGRPFQLEDRWINPAAVPEAAGLDFRRVNANEWLVRNAPYLRADLAFSAATAGVREARLLRTQPGGALLVLERTTWNDVGAITSVRLAFPPGHVMRASA